jgi:alpha-tubulin suppressor-like RCC1 family protein
MRVLLSFFFQTAFGLVVLVLVGCGGGGGGGGSAEISGSTTNNPTSGSAPSLSAASTVKFIQLSGGDFNSTALDENGQLFQWGELQLPTASTVTVASGPKRIGTNDKWKYVSSVSYSSLGIKNDGSLWAWGLELGKPAYVNGNIQAIANPTQVGTDMNWKSVSLGYMGFALAIKTDGSLWAWGYNGDGQVGDGSKNNRSAPVRVGTDTNWTQIVAGYSSSFAIRSDGSLWVWGANMFGDFGDGTNIGSSVPKMVGTDKDWKFISADASVLAIKTDGTLWGWGSNLDGELGIGNTINQELPRKIATQTNWRKVDTARGASLGVKNDGTLWAWGGVTGGGMGIPSQNGSTVPLQVGTGVDWSDARVLRSNGFNQGAIAISLKDGALFTWGTDALGPSVIPSGNATGDYFRPGLLNSPTQIVFTSTTSSMASQSCSCVDQSSGTNASSACGTQGLACTQTGATPRISVAGPLDGTLTGVTSSNTGLSPTNTVGGGTGSQTPTIGQTPITTSKDPLACISVNVEMDGTFRFQNNCISSAGQGSIDVFWCADPAAAKIPTEACSLNPHQTTLAANGDFFLAAPAKKMYWAACTRKGASPVNFAVNSLMPMDVVCDGAPAVSMVKTGGAVAGSYASNYSAGDSLTFPANDAITYQTASGFRSSMNAQYCWIQNTDSSQNLIDISTTGSVTGTLTLACGTMDMPAVYVSLNGSMDNTVSATALAASYPGIPASSIALIEQSGATQYRSFSLNAKVTFDGNLITDCSGTLLSVLGGSPSGIAGLESRVFDTDFLACKNGFKLTLWATRNALY